MKTRVLLLGFLLTAVTFSKPSPQKFSELAWKKIEPIYQEIVKHPFNQELLEGTLSKERFANYSSQDLLYLTAFSKALAILGTKLDDRTAIGNVFQFSLDCLKEKKSQKVEMNPVTFSYSNFLLATAANKSREELAAALLPCFWIYWELASDMKGKTSRANPYFHWIQLYSSPKYKYEVDTMIELTDHLAAESPAQIENMLSAFITAARLEWYFWDEAYKLGKWNPTPLDRLPPSIPAKKAE